VTSFPVKISCANALPLFSSASVALDSLLATSLSSTFALKQAEKQASLAYYNASATFVKLSCSSLAKTLALFI